MNLAILYQNGQKKLFEEVLDTPDLIRKTKELYLKQGKKIEDEAKIFSIRTYFVVIEDKDKRDLRVKISAINGKGQLIDPISSVNWNFSGDYKGIKIRIQTNDSKDITYHIWEIVEYLLGKSNTETIKDLNFNLEVVKKAKREDYTSKQKLILFFSKKENCGKLWKYEEARQAMSKLGLAMVGRGIEGERPREFRYDLGYPFITSEQNKNVPDGSFIVEFPFPTMPRNERRMATANLEKDDWTELFKLI